jgi:hypothetical protein
LTTVIFDFWNTHANIQGNVLAAIATLLITLGGYYLRPSVKLRWGRANAGFHTLRAGEKPTQVNVEKHFLQNTGRKPATNVEFVYGFKPSEVSVWEPRNYEPKITPEGHFVLIIPQIAPKELVIIDSIYINSPAALVLSVKCADCQGKEVEFRVNRHLGDKVNFALLLLMLLGLFYALSLVFNHFIL